MSFYTASPRKQSCTFAEQSHSHLHKEDALACLSRAIFKSQVRNSLFQTNFMDICWIYIGTLFPDMFI